MFIRLAKIMFCPNTVLIKLGYHDPAIKGAPPNKYTPSFKLEVMCVYRESWRAQLIFSKLFNNAGTRFAVESEIRAFPEKNTI